ncbi:MAG: ribose transport system substrate-binding protein [Solirubrobacteraceae bacterium]
MRREDIWEIDCAAMQPSWEPISRRGFMGGVGTALIGASVLGGLLGCGSSDDTSGSSTGSASKTPGAGKTIALSLNGFNTYDQDTAEGVLKALAGTGYKLIGAEAAFDATKEINNIKQLIARQPDGLIVLAASAEGAARGASEAKRAGIPVVAQIWFPVSKDVDSAYYAALQLDTETGGKLTVDYLVKQGITEGKILEITGLDAQPFSEGYKQGLRDALKAHPGLKVVASQQGFYTADGALKVLRPMLSAHPDAKVILDYAAEMGNAIAQELERQKIKDIVHITSDGNDSMIPWLSKDDGAYLKGDRWYSPGEQGIVAVNILRNKLEKDQAPTAANIGVKGWAVEGGTSDPIVLKTRQELATAQNISELPPFGYDQYSDKIPFGA